MHIGNFVEVKNSELGRGAKANHLTYLGDARSARSVNVGAGTITCNYDGVNKSRTVIGDGAFIGSGTMLVAPVTLGAGATIGAGSTITRDAPAGKLTLARAAGHHRGWKRPDKKPGDAEAAAVGGRRPVARERSPLYRHSAGNICEVRPRHGRAGLECPPRRG